MKWDFITRSLLVVAFVALAVPATQAAEVEWMEEVPFAQVLAEAEASGQHVLIDFFATWCGPCKWLDREVYTNADVIEGANDYVRFKVDAEKGEGIEIAERFKVFNYPTTVFLDSAGNEVDRFLGTRPAEFFVEKLANVPKGIGTIGDMQKRLAAAPEDHELRRQVAETLVHQARSEAREHLEKLITVDPDNGKGYGAWAMMMRGDLARRSDDLEGAVKYTEEALAEFGESDPAYHYEGLAQLAYYYRKLNDVDKTVDAERRLLELTPDDPKALNRFAWNLAKIGTALEEATLAAKHAVQETDRDPGYVDTLAEVYFVRGMYDEAIELMKECQASDPEDKYFQDQMKKFVAAKNGA